MASRAGCVMVTSLPYRTISYASAVNRKQEQGWPSRKCQTLILIGFKEHHSTSHLGKSPHYCHSKREELMNKGHQQLQYLFCYSIHWHI